MPYQYPYLKPNEIELVSLLSEGEQGKVWKGRCRGFDVAVKIPLHQTLSLDEYEILLEEVKLMR